MTVKTSYLEKYIFIFFLSIQSSPTFSAIYVHQVSGGVTVFSNVEKVDESERTANGSNKLNQRENQIVKTAVKKSEFPRITKKLQQERDLNRIGILNTELDAEERAFHSATEQRAAADILKRHVVNIAALKREINAVR